METELASWQIQVQQFLDQKNYEQATAFYEEVIQENPEVIHYYWCLGLSYLLQGQEEAAQTTWMFALSQADDENLEEITQELVSFLGTESERQLTQDHLENAWLIRQHIYEIAPQAIENLLKLILLAIELDQFHPSQLSQWQISEALSQTVEPKLDINLITRVLKQVLDPLQEASLEIFSFVRACLDYSQVPDLIVSTIITSAIKINYRNHQPDVAIQLAEICLEKFLDHPIALQHLSCFHSTAGNHQKAIEVAEHFYHHCETTDWKILGSYLLLRALFSAGNWIQVPQVKQQHKDLMYQLIQEAPDLAQGRNIALAISGFYLPYLEDNLQENRHLQNRVSELFQKNSQQNYLTTRERFQVERPSMRSKPLKVGYIAHTLRAHSVGWLCRWLFQYHNHEKFSFTLYCLNQNSEEAFAQNFFVNKVEQSHFLDLNATEIATRINQDKIDILIDLDSLTLDTTTEVISLKPAPIQVSWLGWDASGLPAVDYFIADPYVLPEDAQQYYRETIWRLPHTYIAVDGFEVATPTLRREDLQIPSDAIVYLSAQKGYKRHPETVRLQMKILKEVPNSYFAIKGVADGSTIQEFFTRIAEEEGISAEQLRFLATDPNELTHRANLGIADIVLDTYPYNGATTTLETLWMGIPLVTRVGQQFSARNSYAFMMNAGVTEGIAWTDEEYIEWGIRLGKDENLRWQIIGKLKASRHTSPLWNAQQFTQEMELAYQQMWLKYLQT